MAGEAPASAQAPDAGEGRKVRSLQCPGCGAPLTVRGMLQTEAIACEACGSVIDLSDENLRVLSTFEIRARVKPLIPLGTRGTLLGDLLEVIGFLRRKVTVEGVDYEWGEYLLFNPYKGFRWLTEYNGHWTYVRSMLDRPEGAGSTLGYMGRTFQHFQTSAARVSYVIGEFFWRVEVGEQAHVDDYVAAPYVISCERTPGELNWSLGQYIDPDVLRSAFGLKSALPARMGVFGCQPSPYGGSPPRVYGLPGWLVPAPFLLQLPPFLFPPNREVFRQTFSYLPATLEKSFVTEPFEIGGHTSNVVVHSEADVSNNWIYLSFALINDETGQAYDFGREISYYFGVDGGESWSEGGRDDDAVLPAVPAGRYYLRIEPDGPASAQYTVKVTRDVPRKLYLFFALLALAIGPALVAWRQWSFEVKRWSESDHPMWTPSSSDDD